MVSVLLLAGILAWVGTGFVPGHMKTRSIGEAAIGGSFSLIDGQGKRVTEQDFRGKYMLIFFGFTHCPDICPTTLLLMDHVLTKLGRLADKVTPIFITVDPERDSPQVVRDYAQNFGDRIVPLTGSKEEIQRAIDAYKVYASKAPAAKGGGYMVDHSGFIYLMDPQGRYVAHFAQNSSEQALVDQLTATLR